MSGGGPSVVAIGGGHGLAMSLEGLASWCDDVTAVVSVADDGGSSGRLRSALGVAAPGDMRRCLEALSPPGLARDALGHRFGAGELQGHAAGNVLLAALLESTADPVEALDTLARMVGARGRVLPATLQPVDLVARTSAGIVRGQVAISEAGEIERVATEPSDPPVPYAAEAAIASADLVLLGPGSLFTSVLAAAVVPAIRTAVAECPAPLVYVANLAPQPGETDGMTLADHVAAVRRHGLAPDIILVDAETPDSLADSDLRVVRAPIAGSGGATHDPAALGRAVSELVPRVRA